MPSTAGAGYSEETDSYRAGHDAAQAALVEASAAADLALISPPISR